MTDQPNYKHSVPAEALRIMQTARPFVPTEKAVCAIPNCRKSARKHDAFCSEHGDA